MVKEKAYISKHALGVMKTPGGELLEMEAYVGSPFRTANDWNNIEKCKCSGICQ